METEISEKVWSTDQWNPSKTFAPPFWHDWKGSYSDRSERNGTFHVVLVSRITFKVFMILNPLLQKQNLINQNYVLLTWADEIFLYKILKPLQNKKGQINLRYPTKKQSFSLVTVHKVKFKKNSFRGNYMRKYGIRYL